MAADKDRIETLYRSPFLSCYDLQYADPERTAPFDGTPDAEGNTLIYVFSE